MFLEIRVKPNASKNRVGGTVGDPPRLVVAVQAPAVDGKANLAVIKELAKVLGVKVRDLTIVRGDTNRDKRIVVEGDESELQRRILELSGDPRLF